MHPKIVNGLQKYWWAAALATVGAALALYMYNIGQSSIWFDEAFSVALISKSPSELLHLTAVDVHPPLYYLLLKGWTEIFGLSETALRSFSAVCMAGALTTGLLIVRRYFGLKAAYVVLPFLLFAPFLLRYAQEARMYALVTLICTSATYALLRAEESKRVFWWVLYALLIAAGLYTHYYTGLIWIAHWVWHWYASCHTPGIRFFDKRWLAAYAGAALLFLPWAPTFFEQADAVQGGFWIGPVSHHTLLNVATNILMYMQEWDVKEWLSLAFMVVAGLVAAIMVRAYRAIPNQKQKSYFVLLLCTSFVPGIVLFLISLPPFQPLFVERYLVPAAFSTYLLIGISLVLAPPVKQWSASKIFLGLAILGMFVFGVSNVYSVGNYNYNARSRPHAKELMTALTMRLGSDDAVVVLSPYIYFEFSYYDTRNNVYFVDSDKIVGVIGSTESLAGSPRLVQDLGVFGAGRDEVWLVGGNVDDFMVPDGWTQIGTVQVGDDKALGYKTK